MIPSEQETRLKNRVGWAVHELKQIGAVHDPEPSVRALTSLGSEIDDDQIKDLHRAFQAEERRRQKAKRGEAGLADTQSVWLIRAGRQGERYDYNIEHGLACLGFGDLADVRSFSNKQELWENLRLGIPDRTDKAISSFAGQLWRIRTEVRLGDLVVMPRKGAPQITLGTVTRTYWYDDISNVDWGSHVVSVDWKRTDVPVAAIKQDLQRSLRGQQTIYALNGRDVVWRLQQLMETGQDPGPRPDEDDGPQDLSMLVERFRVETEYPTEAHAEQERLRAEWAEKLVPENIADFSRLDLTGVASRGTLHRARYVYPDVQGVMKWIRQLDEDEYSGLLDSIHYLCWGEDEAWVRYDQLTDRRNSRRLRGYANPTAIRLLAITQPKDFLPLGPYPGVFRRLRRYLNLDRPQGASYGQRVMDANNQLLEHLEPHFGDDTLEMSAFLEWLIKKPPPPDLAELADQLLVNVEFLEDIVSLLEDKGQVILYGPPGTGKTYLARELAKALAPDEACRALVQFHPSTSYEDFFEGYRPAGTGNDGGIRYELTPGPLARMAEQAEATDEQHVMIIDEINRGNLPRVLGELLFLLEYRKESVQTLYRPEEPFELPENLWFIGTMNTADRSIALVDAALRRRFHFLPFFPDKWPMAGLLARWLEREGEPAWVGDLVDAVNDELKKALEGSHLLLGPSHFMKRYGSSPDEQRERLRRIWEYNIEPFIEDQLFGDPDQINRFHFGSIVSRHRAIIERDRPSTLSDEGDLDLDAEALESSETQSSSERSRAREVPTPAWKDQFQGTPTAPTGHDELWKWRASNFPRRTAGRGEFQVYEIGRWACIWVEFALNAGVDPGKHDSQLVEDLLSPHGYSQSSLTQFRRHLREWFETDHDSAG